VLISDADEEQQRGDQQQAEGVDHTPVPCGLFTVPGAAPHHNAAGQAEQHRQHGHYGNSKSLALPQFVCPVRHHPSTAGQPGTSGTRLPMSAGIEAPKSKPPAMISAKYFKLSSLGHLGKPNPDGGLGASRGGRRSLGQGGGRGAGTLVGSPATGGGGPRRGY
jgi:hypothetical protein